MQLLRDNLTLWTSDMQESGETSQQPTEDASAAGAAPAAAPSTAAGEPAAAAEDAPAA